MLLIEQQRPCIAAALSTLEPITSARNCRRRRRRQHSIVWKYCCVPTCAPCLSRISTFCVGLRRAWISPTYKTNSLPVDVAAIASSTARCSARPWRSLVFGRRTVWRASRFGAPVRRRRAPITSCSSARTANAGWWILNSAVWRRRFPYRSPKEPNRSDHRVTVLCERVTPCRCRPKPTDRSKTSWHRSWRKRYPSISE